MSDQNDAARRQAQQEKSQFPSGQALPQYTTQYSWEKQKAYEDEWNKKSTS